MYDLVQPDQNSQSTNNKQEGGLKIKPVLKGRSNLSSVTVKTHTHRYVAIHVDGNAN